MATDRMRSRMGRREFLKVAGAASLGMVAGAACAPTPTEAPTPVLDAGPKPAIPEVPTVEVRLAVAPYADHSHYAIGTVKGWYEDVGINIVPKPYGVKVDMAEQAPGVESGAFDVGTICMSCWAPALDKIAHRFKIFNFSDIFHGHALVAGQLDTDMKSVQEFMAEGMEFDEALTATMQQLKGKRMAQAPGDPQNTHFAGISNPPPACWSGPYPRHPQKYRNDESLPLSL